VRKKAEDSQDSDEKKKNKFIAKEITRPLPFCKPIL